MLSGGTPILMRVRISFDALRLCLLVAAGVTSGYLWRAAFESSSPAEQRIAAPPRVIEKAPAPPVVRIAPHHLTTTKHPAVVSRAVRQAVRTTRSPAALISAHVRAAPPSPRGAPESQPSASGPTTKPPQPSPSPSPAPPPAPATATPPSSNTTTAASPPVSEPVQQTVAQPPASTPTTAPPPPTQAPDDESRPGWGKGDDNHDHTGPGGDDGDKGKGKDKGK